MTRTVSLPYRLYSAPVAWPLGSGADVALAAVVGERSTAEPRTFVAGMDTAGRVPAGLPWLRAQPAQVSPGNGLLVASPRGELALVDQQGGLRLLRDGRDTRGAPLNEALNLVATPAVAVAPGSGALLILSRDFRPHSGSRNALGVWVNGSLAPGFPALLAGIPETQPPLADPAGKAAYVMLRTGQVDALALSTAARLPGFPTAAVAATRPVGGFRFAFCADASALYVATGGSALARVALGGAKGPVISLVPTGTRRLAAIVASGPGALLAWDAASGQLVALDAQGRERGSLPLEAAYGDDAPFLAAHGGVVAVVGAESTDTGSRVDQAFDQRAPAAEKSEIEDIAVEETQIRFGVRALAGPTHQAALDEKRRAMKKGWLVKQYGLVAVDKLLQTGAATRVTLVAGTDAATPRVLVQDRIEGFVPQTGVQQCEHVLPVFWTDPRSNQTLLLVGLNAAASGDAPTPWASQVRLIPTAAR